MDKEQEALVTQVLKRAKNSYQRYMALAEIRKIRLKQIGSKGKLIKSLNNPKEADTYSCLAVDLIGVNFAMAAIEDKYWKSVRFNPPEEAHREEIKRVTFLHIQRMKGEK